MRTMTEAPSLRFRIGTGSRWLAAITKVVLLLLVLLIGALSAPKGPGEAAGGLVVMFVGYCVMLVLGRGSVDLDASGVVVRNALVVHQVSWSGVADFEGATFLKVRLVDGHAVLCWAIQRANAAAMLHRESRVDRIARQAETFRASVGVAPVSGSNHVKRPAWFSAWEWVQLVVVFPAVGALALFLSTAPQ